MCASRPKTAFEAGFTLIELSIVLVIIGLIIGGVLVGEDLIRAAAVRAQITQIEQYNTGVNTFRGKFNAIPGDMDSATATTFGFSTIGTRVGGSTSGQGNGNFVIDGGDGNTTVTRSLSQGYGETAVFWEDLSSPAAGNLIAGAFNTANMSAFPPANISGIALNAYLPPAKIGGGNYVYVFESGGINYFGLSAVSSITDSGSIWNLMSTPGLSELQAYSIDSKVDDGLPTAGNIQAQYLNSGSLTVAPNAATPSTTTCYDTGSNQYSVMQNGGSNINCALGFRFQ